MNCKQNERINQVKVETLVVGIDIGSNTHYARAFDWRGIELGNVFSFSNTREGFDAFKGWMQRLKDKKGKQDIIVGIEPTGRYKSGTVLQCGKFSVKCKRFILTRMGLYT